MLALLQTKISFSHEIDGHKKKECCSPDLLFTALHVRIDILTNEANVLGVSECQVRQVHGLT